jgi:hypothetical protein
MVAQLFQAVTEPIDDPIDMCPLIVDGRESHMANAHVSVLAIFM